MLLLLLVYSVPQISLCCVSRKAAKTAKLERTQNRYSFLCNPAFLCAFASGAIVLYLTLFRPENFPNPLFTLAIGLHSLPYCFEKWLQNHEAGPAAKLFFGLQ